MDYQKIRNFLYQLFDNDISNDVVLEDAIEHLKSTFYFILDHSDNKVQKLTQTMLEMFFCDSLIYLLYREKLGVNTFEEKSILFNFFKFQSVEDLISEIKNNPDLMYELIEYFIRFYETKQSLKILMTNSLNEDELKLMSKISLTYLRKLKKEKEFIDLSLLIQELKEDIQEQVDTHEIFAPKIIIDYLIQIIHQLYSIDYQNEMSLLLEIVDLDYNILKFLIDHGLKNESTTSNISFYEKNTNEMICIYLLNNQKSLINILERISQIVIMQNIEGIPITIKELEKNKYFKDDLKRKKHE